MRGKKFAAQLKVAGAGLDGAGELAPEGGIHTNPKVLDIVARNIRNSCASVVSVSVMMLSSSCFCFCFS